jgi:molybdenum cofactor guanylyltransferase
MPAQPVPGAALPRLDVIILAGGRAARLGGADKPGLVVGQATLAAAVASAAVAAGAWRVILVGPPRADLAAAATVPGGLIVTREQPPGSGPGPALRAALPMVRSPLVAALAADLPFLESRHLLALAAAAAAPARSAQAGAVPPAQAGPALAAQAGVAGPVRAGAVLADQTGRAQWLAGCWPADRLRAALELYTGASLHGLLAPLDPALLSYPVAATEPPPWLDCDTPADLAVARSWELRSGKPGSRGEALE